MVQSSPFGMSFRWSCDAFLSKMTIKSSGGVAAFTFLFTVKADAILADNSKKSKAGYPWLDIFMLKLLNMEIFVSSVEHLMGSDI